MNNECQCNPCTCTPVCECGTAAREPVITKECACGPNCQCGPACACAPVKKAS